MVRIPVAGKISVMVFDKTGTITKSGMDFTAVPLDWNDPFMGKLSVTIPLSLSIVFLDDYLIGMTH